MRHNLVLDEGAGEGSGNQRKSHDIMLLPHLLLLLLFPHTLLLLLLLLKCYLLTEDTLAIHPLNHS